MKSFFSRISYLLIDILALVASFSVAFFFSQTTRYGISNPFTMYHYACVLVFQIVLIVVINIITSPYNDLRKSKLDIITTNLIETVIYFLIVTSLLYAFKLSDRISRYFFLIECICFFVLSTLLKILKYKAYQGLGNSVININKIPCKEKDILTIAMFGHKRVPSREGGIEVVVEELSTRMSQQGHRVVLYNRRGNNVAGKQFNNTKLNDYKGVKIKSVLTVNARGLAAMTSSMFATLSILFKNYDIVHIHGEGPAFFCGLFRLFRKRTIVTIHGLDYKRAKWGKFASWYLKKGETNAAYYADEIIVLSENVQKYFLDTYGRETVFIPNGVNKQEKIEANLITERFGLTKDGYILFLGRIVPEKGIHYLIDAYKKLDTDKKLVIAGGASDSQAYFDEMRKKAADDNRIIFTDFVQDQILAEFYSNAYIYVLPSDLEGMPMSLLEAMSYGNCCVVSDIEECASVVEDKGVLFSQGNVRDIKEKLESLLSDKQTVEDIKQRTSEFVCSKYNWDDVCNRTMELYKSENK